jgi:hypothetical protein
VGAGGCPHYFCDYNHLKYHLGGRGQLFCVFFSLYIFSFLFYIYNRYIKRCPFCPLYIYNVIVMRNFQGAGCENFMPPVPPVPHILGAGR